MKSGIDIDIPQFGRLLIRAIVTDYTGTLSRGGRLTAGVGRRLVLLSELADIHVVTADTFGTVEDQLRGLPVRIHHLQTGAHDVEKRAYAEERLPETRHVAAFGNGNNDRLLLAHVRDSGGLAVAVDNGEGCATETLSSSNLFISGAANALDLLLETRRLIATLRR